MMLHSDTVSSLDRNMLITWNVHTVCLLEDYLTISLSIISGESILHL